MRDSIIEYATVLGLIQPTFSESPELDVPVDNPSSVPDVPHGGGDEVQSPEGGDGEENIAEEEGAAMAHVIALIYPSCSIAASVHVALTVFSFVNQEFESRQDAVASCAHSALKVAADNADPWSFHEAMQRPDADQWLNAAKVEIQAHMESGTWELVELPPDRKAIGSRWVLKVKKDAAGNIERYKGRLNAQGSSQRPGIDFISNEMFAPIM